MCVLELDRPVLAHHLELARRVGLSHAASLRHRGVLHVVRGQHTPVVLHLSHRGVEYDPVDLAVGHVRSPLVRAGRSAQNLVYCG